MKFDAVTGTVKLKNRGETLSLTMKDDAEQPAAGPAAPAPATAAVPPVNPGGVPATGGSGRTIPTRSLRTPANDAAGAAAGPDTENLSPQQQMAAQRAPEETAALYEINRLKNEQLRQSGITLPRLPQHPMFKGGQ